MANLLNILHVIEVGAKVAAPFTPPPFNGPLTILGGLANNTNIELQAQGIEVPSLQSILSLIPPDVLNKLLKGEKVTIEIDGGKIQQAFGDILKKLQDSVKVK